MSKDDDLENSRKSPAYATLLAEWTKLLEEKKKSGNSTTEQSSAKNIKEETVSVPMKVRGANTYEVACKINGLGLNLIFDTGASDISISQTEVQFMLKNGYLSNSDITGTQKYMDANGDIEVGTTLIFKNVDFGGLVLKNVKASVVNNKNAPLLFGQSALSKYGKITIDNEKKLITITKKSTF
jgi:aspartyl protease family protein